MRGSYVWGLSATLAAAGFGLWIAGNGGREGVGSSTAGTINLASLPAAEVWVDGRVSGATPMAISLPEGPHEIVLKQSGFLEHRESCNVKSGSVATIDASLDPIDVTNPDTVRLVAAAFGVTVDTSNAPELHRGAVADGGVSLFFPRNDVRREGLATFRADVTPAYDGTGWLEFHKGKTVLVRQRFEPDTLVTTAKIPDSVTRAVKVGDTITWGIYYEDGRKPVTAQFEVVSKPAAAKKLNEIAADPRLRRQPTILRLQLEAEALQNYRLYSEALTKLLESRATDKESTMPYAGIVSCLRRLDLEDTSLYSESAGKVIGRSSVLKGHGGIASVPSNRLAVSPPRGPVAPRSSTPTPGLPSRSSGTPRPTTPPSDTPLSSGDQPSTTPTPGAPGLLAGNAEQLAAAAAVQAQHAADAAQAALAAQALAAEAALAADAAHTAAGESSTLETVAADAALATANAGALEAQRAAADAQVRATAAAAAAQAAALPTSPSGQGLPMTPARPANPAAPVSPTVPANPTLPASPGGLLPVSPVPPLGTPVVGPPANPMPSLLLVATTNLTAARAAAQEAGTALLIAEADANAFPDDTDKRAAADAARLAADLALATTAQAQAELDRLSQGAPAQR